MKLQLDRDPPDVTCTIGHMWADGQPLCDTLEPPQPIPAGEYRIVLSESQRARIGELWSPRPDCMLPLLLSVPGHTGIRIHAGNTGADTKDCILVGTWTGGEEINASRVALQSLMDMISTAIGNGQPVIIQVNDPL